MAYRGGDSVSRVCKLGGDCTRRRPAGGSLRRIGGLGGARGGSSVDSLGGCGRKLIEHWRWSIWGGICGGLVPVSLLLLLLIEQGEPHRFHQH